MPKAIVIGASNPNGIGYAITQHLRRHDYYVLTPSKHEVHVLNDNYGYMCRHYDCEALVLSHGATVMSPFEDTNTLLVSQVIDTNLTGTILTAQSFIRATKDSTDSFNRKSIVMIGSLGGERVFTNSSVYCASKAAVAHLGRCMAWELAPKGYDVYVIEPGNVAGTNMAAKVSSSLDRSERFREHATQGNIMLPDDVGIVVAELVSRQRKWLAGEPIRLSGGAR